MLLAIDVGNTHSLFALCEAGQVRHSWRVSTDPHRTEDEYAAKLLGLMRHASLEADCIDHVVISCVVPDTLFAIRRCCERYFQARPLVVGHDITHLGMPVLIDNPHELGADRLVNAYAGWMRRKEPLIVIDFGTATTFDVVNKDGAYLGGIIAPGVNLSLEALSRAAAKLHQVPIKRPDAVVGKNTTHAMQSGVYYGYLGMVNAIIARIREEHGEAFYVIATGGLAALYARDNAHIDEVDETLTIEGLIRIFEHTHSQKAA